MKYYWRVACLGLLAGVAAASDWPQWRGPDRTGHVPAGVPVPTTLAAEPRIQWRVKIGDGLASPVVAGGRVFYLDNQNGRETLHAVQEADGRELWRADLDAVAADNQSVPGPRCTPLVDGDRVFAQSSRGELRGFKTTDGSVLWRLNYSENFSAPAYVGELGRVAGAVRHGNSGSPIIDGEHLIAPVGGTNGESVVCFEKANGHVVWKSQNDGAAYAAPIIAAIDGARQLVDFTADGLIGLDLRDGKLLWRAPLRTSNARHVTTPVVAGGLVMVASHELGLVAIRVSRHDGEWQATRAWMAKESAINFSSPVLAGDYLYSLGPSKNIVCVEVKTGKQMWSQPGYIAGSAGQAHLGLIVMGANILGLTDGGQLVLFAARADAFKEISAAQVCGKTWCNPAYAHGNLFLRDNRELLAVALMP